MSDRYPSDVELAHIENWESMNWHDLMDFVREIWWMPDWGFIRNGDAYELHTGGWSGNESVIEALKKSKSMFWGFCWTSSHRGGHFTFEIPPEPKGGTAASSTGDFSSNPIARKGG